MISVVVATKNRPESLLRCLHSLAKSSYRNFEVIVSDQNTKPIHIPDKIKHLLPSLTHLHHTVGGKSAALNAATRLAKGDLAAFTDDDCIVSKSWLKRINDALQKQPEYAAVFGRTTPYGKPTSTHMFCPATYDHPKSHIIRRPAFHASKIGFGNNMAIRTSVLQNTGGFRTWLGPGAVGCAAEDAEMEFRLLLCTNTLLYDRGVRVYHNRWLKPRDFRKLTTAYTRGESACYSYYMFKGKRFARAVIRQTLNRLFCKTILSIHRITTGAPTKKAVGAAYWSLHTLLNHFFGLGIGLCFAIIERQDDSGRCAP